MKTFRDNGFAERRDAAVKAKQTQLEKFRNRPSDDDPTVAKRRAERQAILEARQAREAEREKARLAREAEEAALKALRDAEAEAAEAARRAERAAYEASRPRQIIRDVAMYAERRAAGKARG